MEKKPKTEKSYKTAKEEQVTTYKKSSIRIKADFSSKSTKARRDWNDICKVMKEKIVNQEFHTSQNQPSKIKEKIDSQINKS